MPTLQAAQNSHTSAKPAANAHSGLFDARASLWDENPERAARSRRIVELAEREIGGIEAPRIMDYGCGTGTCSIPLASRASSVLAVDVSPGMLAKVREKAAALGFANIQTLQHDLAVESLEGREFDAIITAMALHHIKDVALVLKRFYSLLVPGGVLLLADLDQEDGSFHSDPDGVEHHGFKRDWILNALWDAGFRMVSIDTAYTMQKPNGVDGAQKAYPVFFMAARIRPQR